VEKVPKAAGHQLAYHTKVWRLTAHAHQQQLQTDKAKRNRVSARTHNDHQTRGNIEEEEKATYHVRVMQFPVRYTTQKQAQDS
jgi:hypothetical protein